MSKLKVNFGEPEHGWIKFSIFDGETQVLRFEASDIYPSFDELVKALLNMLDASEEQLVSWAEEPAETEMLFSRRGEEDVIGLEIAFFETFQKPRKKRKPNSKFIGTYDEICLPFWRALRELQNRSFSEEKEEDWRWTLPFPHRELALLTGRLGKS